MALSNLINRGAESDAAKKQRLELWDALTRYIHDRGGWVVSVPGQKLLRLEVPENSELPIRLAEKGFKLNYVGNSQRIVPGGSVERFKEVDGKRVVWHAGISNVDIIEIMLTEK